MSRMVVFPRVSATLGGVGRLQPVATVCPRLFYRLQSRRSFAAPSTAGKEKVEKIPAETVKKLRKMTGSSMGQCQRALTECMGNVKNAVIWLKQRNVDIAKARLDRFEEGAFRESLVAMVFSEEPEAQKESGLLHKGCLLRLGAETDFVVRNEHFQQAALECARNCLSASETSSPDAFEQADKKNKELLEQLGAKMGEGMGVVECVQLEGPRVAGYVHRAAPTDLAGCGKIGCILSLASSSATGSVTSQSGASESEEEHLQQASRRVAQHIVGQRPTYCREEDVPEDVLEAERQICRASMLHGGELARHGQQTKSDVAIEKKMEGKVRSLLQQEVLYNQKYLFDESLTVREFLEAQGLTLHKYRMLRTAGA